jgi:heme oxygenase
MNPAHRALRDATAQAHEAVDAVFSRFDLTDATDYAAFLGAHAEAFLPIEAALDAAGAADLIEDWPERKRGDLILQDLTQLRHPGEGRDPESQAKPFPALGPGLRRDDEGWICGTLYVLEGSRLGGKLLARRLAPGLPANYLNANQPSGNWRLLLERIDTILYRPDSLAVAIAAAREAFAAFERSGSKWLKEDSCPNRISKSI